METLAAIINVSSDKLSFIGGVTFVLVSIFCTKAVRLGPVQLPAIDHLGRGMSAAIGILLLLWALFMWIPPNVGGLFSNPPKTKISYESGSIKNMLFSAAHAADKQGLPPKQGLPLKQEWTLKQYHPIRVKISDGEEIGIYADNVRAIHPSRIVVFKLNEKITPDLGKKISYDSLIEKIGHSAILLEASATYGGQYTFTSDRGQHTLKVERILWYVFGTDYMVVSLSNRLYR